MAESHVEATLNKDKEARNKMVEEVGKRQSARPTPTQEELDRAKLGETLTTHEDDGSGPDPRAPDWHKASEASKPSGGGYQTRQSRPAAPSSGSSS